MAFHGGVKRARLLGSTSGPLYLAENNDPKGVRTTTDIPEGVTCGYVEGEYFLSDKIQDNMPAKKFFEVRFEHGRLTGSPSDAFSLWMQLVRPARNEREQNLVASRKSASLLVFRSLREISAGEELLAWYDPDVSAELGLAHSVEDLKGTKGYSCTVCSASFRHPNPLRVHLRFSCKQIKVERKPTITSPTSIASLFRSGSNGSFGDPHKPELFSVLSSSSVTSPTRATSSPTTSSSSSKRSAKRSQRDSESRVSAFHTYIRNGTVEREDTEVEMRHKEGESRRMNPTKSPTRSATKTSPVSFSVERMLSTPHDPKPKTERVSPTSLPVTSSGLWQPHYPVISAGMGLPLQKPTVDPFQMSSICYSPAVYPFMRYYGLFPSGGAVPTSPSQQTDHFLKLSANPGLLKMAGGGLPGVSTLPREPSKLWELGRSHILHPGSSSFNALPGDRERFSMPQSCGTGGKNKRGHLCIYCGKLYSRKYGLKIHLRTHTGYKPLKCKVCLRPFGDPSNLNKHIRLHAEGDTPYRCEHCGKVLVRRRDLERHIRSRHPAESIPKKADDSTDGSQKTREGNLSEGVLIECGVKKGSVKDSSPVEHLGAVSK